MIKLAVSEFKWSSQEQVYPFEKDINGNTLYCKEVNFGAGPNSGHKLVAHSLSNYNVTKLFSMQGFISQANNGFFYTVPVGQAVSDLTMWLTPTDIDIYSVANWTVANIVVRLTYSK
jgi:hypothetical protein